MINNNNKFVYNSVDCKRICINIHIYIGVCTDTYFWGVVVFQSMYIVLPGVRFAGKLIMIYDKRKIKMKFLVSFLSICSLPSFNTNKFTNA